ncbi:MAG: 3-deoxy-manno-octulosonate cytidylyltransferase [Bacteroidales bacterium]|jgi:3-deoxy-manno-octulosonate cytidylyltransferase (CMP-KDO synthetase)|nr:3-deoxy-manno-octulosonate cytidylyltransferase [Bacteroidales bacterium]
MQFIAIIPARYHSTRFEGKPLADIAGKKMIIRTLEQVSKVKSFSKIVVATDDKRILDTVVQAGGEAVLTSADCPSGTDRCAMAFNELNCEEKNCVVVNIQGDEPFINPLQINELIDLFQNSTTKIQIATLVCPIKEKSALNDPNIVKVVFDFNYNALYFSRLAIPYKRDNSTSTDNIFYRHIGIYAYQASVLQAIVQFPKSPLETAESLEQLRWLQNGYTIKTHISHFDSPIGIDVPQDIQKAIYQSKNQ